MEESDVMTKRVPKSTSTLMDVLVDVLFVDACACVGVRRRTGRRGETLEWSAGGLLLPRGRQNETQSYLSSSFMMDVGGA